MISLNKLFCSAGLQTRGAELYHSTVVTLAPLRNVGYNNNEGLRPLFAAFNTMHQEIHHA